MTDRFRVTWKATGHESSIPAHRFDPERHTKLDKPGNDGAGDALPPKYRTALDGKPAAARRTTSSAAPNAPAATRATDENGQQAGTEKEKD